MVERAVSAPRRLKPSAAVRKAADVVAERQRQWLAEVTVARPLEAEQQERLALGLRRDFGRDLVMDVTVDPHVVGG
ncbi:F0F1 ATP synthase subunit delta, partial [Micrococcus sp. SIMBA_131]